MEWVYDDGGRSQYFKGEAGDCVCRAIAIATGQDYKDTYRDLAALNKKRYGKRSARNGIDRKDIHTYLQDRGFTWHPTMGIGTGCKVHMRKSELPSGRLVCSLSGHVAAVIDGVLYDTYDSTRCGTRCVYGYWQAPDPKPRKRAPRISRDEFADLVGAYLDDFDDGLMSAEEFGQLCELAARRRGGR